MTGPIEASEWGAYVWGVWHRAGLREPNRRPAQARAIVFVHSFDRYEGNPCVRSTPRSSPPLIRARARADATATFSGSASASRRPSSTRASSRTNSAPSASATGSAWARAACHTRSSRATSSRTRSRLPQADTGSTAWLSCPGAIRICPACLWPVSPSPSPPAPLALLPVYLSILFPRLLIHVHPCPSSSSSF